VIIFKEIQAENCYRYLSLGKELQSDFAKQGSIYKYLEGDEHPMRRIMMVRSYYPYNQHQVDQDHKYVKAGISRRMEQPVSEVRRSLTKRRRLMKSIIVYIQGMIHVLFVCWVLCS